MEGVAQCRIDGGNTHYMLGHVICRGRTPPTPARRSFRGIEQQKFDCDRKFAEYLLRKGESNLPSDSCKGKDDEKTLAPTSAGPSHIGPAAGIKRFSILITTRSMLPHTAFQHGGPVEGSDDFRAATPTNTCISVRTLASRRG
jgi:hypothetical protein